MKKHGFLSILLMFTAVMLTAQNFQKSANGVKTSVQSMDVEVQFYSPSIVRVFKAPENLNPKKEICLL